MTSQGLDIGLDEFKFLSVAEKNIIIYKNLLDIKGKVSSFKFQSKINYIWLSALTIALGLKKLVGF